MGLTTAEGSLHSKTGLADPLEAERSAVNMENRDQFSWTSPRIYASLYSEIVNGSIVRLPRPRDWIKRVLSGVCAAHIA